MKLTIKTSSTEQYTITIPENSTVGNLKLAAIVASNSLESASINTYSLFFNNQMLDLSKNISDYEIHDYDTISIACSLSESVGSSSASLPLKSSYQANSLPENSLAVAANKKELSSKVKQSSGVSKKRKSSKKCNFANCNNASLRIIGNCQDCGGKYCAKHRLLENHLCVGLQNCKNIAFSRNANKLHQEQTISQKV